MTRRIISTVGTSLHTNAARSGISSQDHAALQAYLRQAPQRASAEANALSRLYQQGDALVFLHSDTPEGRACSDSLVAFYQNSGVPARSEGVKGLSYDEKGFVHYGLQQFVKTLSQEIRAAKRSGELPLINATGGFKAEIAYATAVGLVFGVDVCYIHEKFGDIVTLPATPIAWDYSLFAWYSDFFEWLDSEPRQTTEVTQRLNALPEAVRPLVMDDADGYSYLSPLGEAYLEAFRGQQETRRNLALSSQADGQYRKMDYAAQTSYRGLLERLRLGEQGDWTRSAEAVGGGIYKFPKGHSPHRVFFSEREGTLFVLELCGHEDERRYQALIQGIRWTDYDPDTFSELV